MVIAAFFSWVQPYFKCIIHLKYGYVWDQVLFWLLNGHGAHTFLNLSFDSIIFSKILMFSCHVMMNHENICRSKYCIYQDKYKTVTVPSIISKILLQSIHYTILETYDFNASLRSAALIKRVIASNIFDYI